MSNNASTTKKVNVDESEIAKFEALAARWWDKNSEFKPLHEINPLRLQYIDEHASLAHKTVLDVGCGGGILTESMAIKGAQVSGIDLAKALVKVAQLHALETGIEVQYEQVSAEQFAQQHPQKFDIVTCMEMLEHVPDPAAIISACYSLVKPGGSVFFSTLNRNPKSYLLAIIGAEYLLNLLPKGTHDYKKFIRPAELARWVRQTNLTMKELIGLTYNPFNKQYRLCSDLNVNYIAYTVREEN